MNIKPFLNSSAGMLFFLLLFSKPYVARCQAPPSTNEPVKKVVRIEVDTMIEHTDNLNGKKVIIIEDGELPADFEWTELESIGNDGHIVIIDKQIDSLVSFNEDDAAGQPKVVIKKEVKIIKLMDATTEEVAVLKKSTNDATITSTSEPMVGLKLYPNPTAGHFTLEFEQPSKGKTEVVIYDLAGKEVYRDSAKGKGTYKNEIDLSKNGSGTYLIHIHTGNNHFVKKLILQQ